MLVDNLPVAPNVAGTSFPVMCGVRPGYRSPNRREAEDNPKHHEVCQSVTASDTVRAVMCGVHVKMDVAQHA
jgi:hypothetical protein